jgi:hypothetical protein
MRTGLERHIANGRIARRRRATGSIRKALKMMLEDSHQPIFGEATRMQLPTIDRVDFMEYLDFQCDATGKPADAVPPFARSSARTIGSCGRSSDPSSQPSSM